MKLINFCLFALLFTFYLYSEESVYDEIVTVASITPLKDQNIASSVDVINNDLLELQSTLEISKLLRNNFALDISTNGGMGQLASVFLRGHNSNQTLVKINGIKINPNTAGGASFYNLDADLVSRIEVGYGALSAVHGSEAMGGVINISTSDYTETSSFQVGLSFGPDEFKKRTIKTNGKNEALSYGIAHSTNETNGYPVLSNSNLDRGYENKSSIADISFEKDDLEYSFSAWDAEGYVEYLLFGQPVSQDFENNAYGSEIKFNLNNYYFLKANINSSKDLIRQNELNYLEAIDYTQTKRNFLEISANKLYKSKDQYSYSLGWSKENEDVGYSSHGISYKAELETTSIFGSLGLIPNETQSFLVLLRRSDHKSYGNQLIWNINFIQNLEWGWDLKLSKGKAFRSPNSSELYGFGSNIDLKPETSNSYEIGLNKRFHERDLSFVYFNNDTNNLINFDYIDYILKNTAKSKNSGFELRVKWLNTLLNGNLVLRTQNPTNQDKERLLRRSKNSISFNFNKSIHKYRVNINVSAFDDRVDFGKVNLPGYVLFNLGIYRQIKEDLSLSIRLENLFDKEYFTAATTNAYYLNQDRSFWIKLNYKLR
ncbi:MAG: hypothetical protein CMD53_00030 [Gammaproteobacteria bacterium]|nr:hypothetical protein [Gammaproteobacteria bacterium]